MYVCMYVCMYQYMYVSMIYVCMYTDMYVGMHVEQRSFEYVSMCKYEEPWPESIKIVYGL